MISEECCLFLRGTAVFLSASVPVSNNRLCDARETTTEAARGQARDAPAENTGVRALPVGAIVQRDGDFPVRTLSETTRY